MLSKNVGNRRNFLRGAAVGAGALIAPSLPSFAQSVKFKFAVTVLPWGDRLADAIHDTAKAGFPGIEFFPNNVTPYLSNPLPVKKMLDDAGLQICSCSNPPGNFYDRATQEKVIADHVKLARDFLAPFGNVKAFKCNPGGRPGDPGVRAEPTTVGAATIDLAVTDDHIKIAAESFNKIGEETKKLGIKLAVHPHASSLLSTQKETRRFLELTDPNLVFLTIDTAHVQLAGFDPLELMKEQWPRVAEIHYKDLPPTMRGNRTYAPPMMGPSAGGHGYWRNLGGLDSGGVDFPAIHRFLVSKGYDGWISIDLDISMLEGKDLEETNEINARYIRDVLHVPMPPRNI